MTKTSFAAALNEQVGNEFAAHQQYVAIAVHYDAETLPRLAAFFYRQAVEERNHAMMLTQYLLDADLEVATPGVAAPEASPTSSHRSSWRSPRRSGLPNRSALWRDKPGRRATTRASSSCSGSSGSSSRRSRRCRTCSASSSALRTTRCSSRSTSSARASVMVVGTRPPRSRRAALCRRPAMADLIPRRSAVPISTSGDDIRYG